MRCFTQTRSSTSLAPIPERSRILGEPSVPAETTTSFVACTACVSVRPFGWNSGLRTYATPVALFSLHRFYSFSKEAKDTRQSQNSRVEYDVLHMYTRQEVEIGAGIFERVNHVVRHIRAGARLCIYPSVTQRK